jgi:GAF domain-containing protein
LKYARELAEARQALAETLEQQTATSEVLGVISSSPGQLQCVFEAMLANATRLCEAKFGVLFRSEGDALRAVALHGAPAAYAKERRRNPIIRPSPDATLGRAVTTKQTVQINDVLDEPDYFDAPSGHTGAQLAKLAGARTVLAVPMVKENDLMGAILIYRQEVRPFTDKQIELVSNFAKQAVIAIENTRLLNQLRQRTADLGEALEQQTATSEVLRVVSSSPGELQPVFAAMLENATRICEAKFGFLFRYDAGAFNPVAMLNVPPALEDFMRRRGPYWPQPGLPLHRVLETKKIAHTIDQAAEQVQTPSAKLAGARTHLAVPMLKEGEIVGAISIYRQEVRPFTDKQIELVQNFAHQAVIAIENTRLLNELRQRTDDLGEALEQQTATSEVLQVISSSPGELGPVFEALLANAVRICEASFGNLLLYDGDAFRHVALHNAPQSWTAEQQRDPIAPRRSARFLYHVADTKQVVHVTDIAVENPEEPIAKIAGARTLLIVPMLKENELVGVIAIYRQEVRPFTDKHIELVQNFANQAVIAIENTRLLNELRQRTDDLGEALEQQTATSEVLRVISTSPGELEPVFQAMLENAARVCEANLGNIFRLQDGIIRPVASLREPKPLAEFFQHGPHRPHEDAPIMRVARTKQPVHVIDFAAERAYIDRNPLAIAAVELGGIRTLLVVPMLKGSDLVGAIAIYRQEVRPFTDKQIELVKGFAAQAVIAIENTFYSTNCGSRLRIKPPAPTSCAPLPVRPRRPNEPSTLSPRQLRVVSKRRTSIYGCSMATYSAMSVRPGPRPNTCRHCSPRVPLTRTRLPAKRSWNGGRFTFAATTCRCRAAPRA